MIARCDYKLKGQVFTAPSEAMVDPTMLSLRQLLEKARQGMDITPFVRVSDQQYDTKGDLDENQEFDFLDDYNELASYNHYGMPSLDELYDAQMDFKSEYARVREKKLFDYAEKIAKKLSKKAAPLAAQPNEDELDEKKDEGQE